MNCIDEIQFLVDCIQDYISTLPKSAQVAVAEKAQVCVNRIQQEFATKNEITTRPEKHS